MIRSGIQKGKYLANSSSIEWTEATWNPVTGCTKVSDGCTHCYAERMSFRLQAMGKPQYADAFKLTIHPETLGLPSSWKSPKLIFVNSMSDLFHQDIPLAFIQQVFATMNECARHTFQILTKRPHLALNYSSQLPWPPNVWLGTSVEDRRVLDRVAFLREIPAAIRFLSVEPLIGPIWRLPLRKIDWVIVGGESGPGARPMQPEWVRTIRDRCTQRGVPFFFKQWGGINKKESGRTLDGRTWNQMPNRVNYNGRHSTNHLASRASYTRKAWNPEDVPQGMGGDSFSVTPEHSRRPPIR